MGLFRRKKKNDGALPEGSSPHQDSSNGFGATRQEDSTNPSLHSAGDDFLTDELFEMGVARDHPRLQRIQSEIQRIDRQISQTYRDVNKANTDYNRAKFMSYLDYNVIPDSDHKVKQVKLDLSTKQTDLEKLKERKFDLESQYQLEAEKIAGVTKNTGSVSRTSPLSEHAETVNSFCTKCGNALKPEAKFCGKCGTARS